jgi:2-hydroxychromene-2-carboxylate isomerase
MLWLKRFSSLSEQCAEGSLLERFVDEIYDSFWKRELDAEDASVILAVLEQIGAPTEGFLKYAQTDGAALNSRLQQSSFNAGIYGVPTYILPNESETDPQYEMFFGREHLPRISWLLTGRKGQAPDISYKLNSDVDEEALSKSAAEPRSAPELKISPKELTTFFDFNSLQSYLALESILSFKAEGISINWRPVSSMYLKEPPEETKDEDRSTKHRRFRAEYQVNDIQRYAPHDLNQIHGETDCRFANMGLLWLHQELKMDKKVIDEYVQSVFYHHWRDNRPIIRITDIERILLGIKKINSLDQELKWQDAFFQFCLSKGSVHLEIAQTIANNKGINITPTFLIGSEPFKGRAHLPLILARFKAGI